MQFLAGMPRLASLELVACPKLTLGGLGALRATHTLTHLDLSFSSEIVTKGALKVLKASSFSLSGFPLRGLPRMAYLMAILVLVRVLGVGVLVGR